jgi:3-deoxy-D-manno-octulosonic acid kinase
MSDARVLTGESGVVIYDHDRYPSFAPDRFDTRRWRAEGASTHRTTGRGGVLILAHEDETWVYRHYHRGGFVARFVYDHYLWTGLSRTRAFREWLLLDRMHAAGLPVPRPVAARVCRQGPLYQADIITILLPDTRPLSSFLSEAWLDHRLWERIGVMLSRFHREGIDHPDLTAHNILVDVQGAAYLVDFDNASMRPGNDWQTSRMARLKRSLHKVSLETGTRFDETAWRVLNSSYATYRE